MLGSFKMYTCTIRCFVALVFEQEEEMSEQVNLSHGEMPTLPTNFPINKSSFTQNQIF